MSECTHDCSSCGESCSARDNASSLDMTEKLNQYSNVKKVIAVSNNYLNEKAIDKSTKTL